MEAFVIYLIAAVVVVLVASLAVLGTILDVMFLVANCAINSWQWVRGSKAHAHSQRESITELVISNQKPPAGSAISTQTRSTGIPRSSNATSPGEQ